MAASRKRAKIEGEDEVSLVSSASPDDHVDPDQMEAEIAEERLENKRRREAARKYLETLKNSSHLTGTLATQEAEREEAPFEVDAADTDDKAIAKRLQQDILQVRGRVFRKIAHEYEGLVTKPMQIMKGINHTPTCVVVSPDHSFVFAGYKSGDIIQWNGVSGHRVHLFSHDKKRQTGKYDGHRGHVLAIAISPDGKYLASGGSDKLLIIWDIKERKIATVFTAHRGAITGLAFQLGSMTLFSTSTDRTVKIWNIDQLAYVDTLFGHQDEILSIDALTSERCVTVGARDRTARLWKVVEETQLVFRGSENNGGSLDVINMIDTDHFATGSDTGAISIWGLHRKKPLIVEPNAHNGPISALLSYHLTDLLVSASHDGCVKLWRIDSDEYKHIALIAHIPLVGCVNGLSLSGDGSVLAVAIGKDHRLGRWTVKKDATNRIILIRLK